MTPAATKNSNPAGNPKIGEVSGTQADSSDTIPDKPEQFDQFEKLTRKLVQVSKDELDEQRKAGS